MALRDIGSDRTPLCTSPPFGSGEDRQEARMRTPSDHAHRSARCQLGSAQPVGNVGIQQSVTRTRPQRQAPARSRRARAHGAPATRRSHAGGGLRHSRPVTLWGRPQHGRALPHPQRQDPHLPHPRQPHPTPQRALPSGCRAWLLALLLGACGNGTDANDRVPSRFLETCNDACNAGLSCLEGVCTKDCTQEAAACEALSASAQCRAPERNRPRTCDVLCS